MDEQIENKGRRPVDPKYLTKFRLKIQQDFAKIKHKTVLRKKIGSNKVSDYFNNGIASIQTENAIIKYFEDYGK